MTVTSCLGELAIVDLWSAVLFEAHSQGSLPEGRGFNSRTRYEENLWDTYISEGSLAFGIFEVALYTAFIPRANKFVLVQFRFMMVIVVPVGVLQVRDAGLDPFG
jgi:hypothetical protein